MIILSQYQFAVTNTTQMLNLACSNNSDCQWMYQCNDSTLICQHADIFPLSFYTVLIYIIIGLGCALVNVAGNCMGLFKMLLIVLALNYQLGQATALSEAMVVGAAIPNFVTIIFKKHPQGHTTLVNYRLLELIIPCCLLGSILGVITESLTPKIAQLIILVVVFSYFTFTFTQKLRNLIRTAKVNPLQIQEETHQESLISTDPQNPINQEATYVDIFQQTPKEQPDQQKILTEEEQKIIQYEKSLHGMDILQSAIVFIAFELLAFLLQGKLPFYDISNCSPWYFLGLVAMVLVTLAYLYWVKTRFVTFYAPYRKYGIPQDIYLDQPRQFITVVLGSFAAGFIQGTLGLGAGTCIMMLLLSFNIDPTIASAISGYQILFTGAASLFQFYINGEVKVLQSLWFLGICLILGGAATLGLFHVIGKLNKVLVNKFMISVILALCLLSLFLTIPTGLQIYRDDGWEGLTKIKFHC